MAEKNCWSVRDLAAGSIALMLLFLLALPACVRLAKTDARASCALNLHEWHRVFLAYADEHDGLYPPPSPYMHPGFFVDAGALYPDYWTDYSLALCPGDSHARSGVSRNVLPEGAPAELVDHARRAAEKGGVNSAPSEADKACLHYLMSLPRSYVYPGYVVWDWWGISALRAASVSYYSYNAESISVAGTVCDPPVEDLQLSRIGDTGPVLGTSEAPPLAQWGHPNMIDSMREMGGTSFHRVSQDFARRFARDPFDATGVGEARASIAVLWDAPAIMVDGFAPESPEQMPDYVFNHDTPGANVLYLDGHVEFLPFPSDAFPMNDAFTKGLDYGMQGSGRLIGQG